MQHTIIKELLKRPIAYQAVIAKTFGSVKLALMWSQLYYWSDKTKDREGWIYKTQVEMFDETGLSRKEQDTARKLAEKLGVLEEKLAGSPPKIHYRIDFERTIELVGEYLSKNKTKIVVTEKAITPGKQAVQFFDWTEGSRNELQTEIFEYYLEKTGADPNKLGTEFKKFILYWTEPNSTGTKVRWQIQKTFDVKRRLLTWLGNAKMETTQGNRAGSGTTI